MSSIQIPPKDRLILSIMGFIGIISMIAIIRSDDPLYTRFWSSILHNGVFFTLIALMAIFFLCINRTAYAGWSVGFKRVWEAMSQFLWVGLFLMIIISLGIYFGWHHLYHWADPETAATDKIIKGKSSFLNVNFYSIIGLGILLSWLFFAHKMRRLSIEEDDHDDAHHSYYKKMKFWAAVFLPIAGFSSAVAIWLWYMSIDPHWYSTMYAWYTGASTFVSMIALTILLLVYLKSRGHYHNVNMEHFHDLGKFLFAFSVFWTYLWFSQYMLIWYGNVGEETVYFYERINNYPVLFYGNLVLNFVLPFLILMPNTSKRKYGTLILVSIIVFFGHWWDGFQMVKPGVMHTAHELLKDSGHSGSETETIMLESGKEVKAHTVSHDSAHQSDSHGHQDDHASVPISGYYIPGLADIGLLIGFLALFFGTTLYFLSKAPLVPKNDPYLKESLHHHT